MEDSYGDESVPLSQYWNEVEGEAPVAGLPSRVMTMRSPCSTRRRTSPPLFRSLRTAHRVHLRRCITGETMALRGATRQDGFAYAPDDETVWTTSRAARNDRYADIRRYSRQAGVSGVPAGSGSWRKLPVQVGQRGEVTEFGGGDDAE